MTLKALLCESGRFQMSNILARKQQKMAKITTLLAL
jgi:hypothetical protein